MAYKRSSTVKICYKDYSILSLPSLLRPLASVPKCSFQLQMGLTYKTYSLLRLLSMSAIDVTCQIQLYTV